MDFGKAIIGMKVGEYATRLSWEKDKFITKQIPSKLEGLIIEKIQSLPSSAKKLLIEMGTTPKIEYKNQLLCINGKGEAESWLPTAEDIFAEDWILIKFEK